jgi:isoprenylcysteine carboxyl methyltransferase (ICMT) family protein YpbQ
LLIIDINCQVFIYSVNLEVLRLHERWIGLSGRGQEDLFGDNIVYFTCIVLQAYFFRWLLEPAEEGDTTEKVRKIISDIDPSYEITNIIRSHRVGKPRGCHRDKGWNQQIMMLENGRLYHSMLPNFLRYFPYITIILRYFPIYFGQF